MRSCVWETLPLDTRIMLRQWITTAVRMRSTPKSLPALLGLVAVHEQIKNWQGALRHIDEILDIDSANLTALYKKQAVLERLEKWDDLLSCRRRS